MRVWRARKGLTRKGSEDTVRSTSPLRQFVLGSLETARDRRRSIVWSASFGVEHESRRGLDTQGEIPESAWRQSGDARKSMQKVRLKP
jgi:hypothetical protein